MIIVHEEFIAHAQLRAKVWRPIVQVISKMQLRKCKKGKPLYSMRAVAFKYGIPPTTLHDITIRWPVVQYSYMSYSPLCYHVVSHQ